MKDWNPTPKHIPKKDWNAVAPDVPKKNWGERAIYRAQGAAADSPIPKKDWSKKMERDPLIDDRPLSWPGKNVGVVTFD